MIPACTHVIELELDDHSINLNEATAVYVTLRQCGNTMTFTGEQLEIDEYNVSVLLTQEESLKLYNNRPAQVQVNWITESLGDVSRAATDIADIEVREQLLRRVLP